MIRNRTKTVKKRRKQGKTNYKRRLILLKGEKHRIVFRKTNRQIILQIIESNLAQDKTITGATSKEMLKYGWPKEKIGSLKSLSASYLTAYLLGKKYTNKNKSFIFDIGLIPGTKGSRAYASIKGLVDSGFKISSNKEIFPPQDIIEKFDFFNNVKREIDKYIGVKNEKRRRN